MERIDWIDHAQILKISKPNGNLVYEFGRSDDQIVTMICFYNVGN